MLPAIAKSELSRENSLTQTITIGSIHNASPSLIQKTVLNEKAEKASTRDEPPSDQHDEFEVYWNEPADGDPENPVSWSHRRKAAIIGLVAFVSFLTPLASAMFTPGIPQLMEDFHQTSSILATFVVSIFVLGFALGPLIVAPVSELMGRNVVYHTCNVFFVIFTVCCAVSVNMGMMLVFRFLAGFAGVGALTIGGGTIADMIPIQQRGAYMSLWSLGPIFGPIVGPIAGGFLIESTSWRWTFWVIAIASGVVTVVCWFILKETYATVILERKAAKLRKQTGDSRYHVRGAPTLTKKQIWSEAITRPIKILLFSPVASLMCVYIAILFGLFYILFTTFTYVFQDQYGFSTEAAGLSYVGSGIGTLIGLGYSSVMSDRAVKKKIANGLIPIPEDRLPFYMVLPGVLFIPAGVFMYGWGAEYQVHWIVPEIGTSIQSAGSQLIIFCVLTYLVDSYGVHAASALAACAVLRNLAGALIPMGGLKVYEALGVGWGNTMLAFVTLAIAPIPVLFRIFGQRLRERHLRHTFGGEGEGEQQASRVEA